MAPTLEETFSDLEMAGDNLSFLGDGSGAQTILKKSLSFKKCVFRNTYRYIVILFL